MNSSVVEVSSSPAWSTPYFGVSHLGRLEDYRWATVADWGAFAELTRWLKGSEPIQGKFDTAEQARAAGEAWVASGALV